MSLTYSTAGSKSLERFTSNLGAFTLGERLLVWFHTRFTSSF